MSDHKKPVANNTENKENGIKSNEKKLFSLLLILVSFFPHYLSLIHDLTFVNIVRLGKLLSKSVYSKYASN